MAADGVPYIGSQISLTSKSAIRYVGTLYNIDTNESTVALKDVRSFGTEHRPRAAGPIPPSPEVYEYIIFRGPDIADLHVISTAPAPRGLAGEDGQSAASPAAEPTPAAAVQSPPPTSALVAASEPEPRASVAAVPGKDENEAPSTPSTANGRLPQRQQQPTVAGGYRGAKPWGPPPSAASAGGYAAAAVVREPPCRGPPPIANGGGGGGGKGGGPGAGAGLPAAAAAGADGNGGGDGGGGGGGVGRGPPGRGGRGGGRRDGGGWRDGGGRDGRRGGGRDGGGDGGGRRRQRGGGGGVGGRSCAPGMLMPDEEFDFEAMNAKFDKATLSTTLQEVGGGTGVGGAGVVGLDDGKNAHAPGHGTAELEHIEVKYDKATSFFDNLEPPSRERATPAERAYRRNADFETFGETHTVQNRGYGRFRGGRRGRGGVNRGGRQDV